MTLQHQWCYDDSTRLHNLQKTVSLSSSPHHGRIAKDIHTGLPLFQWKKLNSTTSVTLHHRTQTYIQDEHAHMQDTHCDKTKCYCYYHNNDYKGQLQHSNMQSFLPNWPLCSETSSCMAFPILCCRRRASEMASNPLSCSSRKQYCRIVNNIIWKVCM